MVRVLSGIQPSGRPHLGNYFGAIQQHLDLHQEAGTEAFYFIADFHALTTVQDPKLLAEYVREVAATYLALGLDPERAVFWRQSDVPEVTEVTWLLATVTGMGLLERGHSYKDKIQRGIAPSAGLFFYPVLMASDILSFDADSVPVGKDQVQHIEFAQDMGNSFNAIYGSVFRRPEWRLSKTPRVLGTDGEKMSKSYGNDVWIFEEGKALKKAIGKIPTDSRPPDEPKDPDTMVLFSWLELLCPPEQFQDLARRTREGGERGPGYGELKQAIAAQFDLRFSAARTERLRLLAHEDHLNTVLKRGAAKAQSIARDVRDRAYRACGLR